MTVSDPFVVAADVQRGACSECGYETILTWRGTPGPHFEQRVHGFNPDRTPRVQAGIHRCKGWNKPAEPLGGKAA